MKNIKACFFDIDGTLVRSDHTVSQAVINAVQRLEREGVSPVIATGRSYEALLPVKEKLGIHSPVIAYNGAMIINGKDGSIMTHHTLPDETARKIIQKARNLDFHILAYREEELIYEQERPEAKEYYDRIKLASRIVNFDEMAELNLTKCLIVADHEKLEPVKDFILESYADKVNCFFSDPRFLEIVPCGIDKGKAVAEVMGLLGGTIDQAMAMGDGFNDLPMLQAARWGVVMENAQPELKKMFPPERIAPRCDDDGVVTYLTDFFGWE
jgi:Cof subfamily protein (haloacid dehalogenase superfamily)